MSKPSDKTQEQRLEELSEMILQQGKNLIPHTYNLTKDIERTDGLWRYNTRKGIMLSSGGVENSLLSGIIVGERESLKSFNKYRNDLSTSANITSEDMKRFCAEEGLISETSNIKDSLSATFCLGSHEGFTRLARCLYSEKNKEMIYSVGGYGLLARAVSTMNPTPYRVHLAEINRDNGEKILVEDLEKIILANPKAKTLYLEAKTMCGAVYDKDELEQIVKLCQQHDIFFIFDTAHANMEFEAKNKFPDITEICQQQEHKKFAMIFTGSKTYGLERARIGFVILGGKKYGEDLAQAMVREGSRTHGSYGDLPFEIARDLISFPLKERQKFLEENRQRHRFNLNLMIGYIEGVNSSKIDEDLRQQVAQEIPEKYQSGIKDLKLVYRPEGGIQLKVNMASLQNKYLTNIRMLNSEIFSYALQKMGDVSTLNSYQVMDPEGFGMRLSFSIKDDVHQGMSAMHDFVNSLTDQPTPNKFMPNVELAETLIFPSEEEIEQNIKASRDEKLEGNQLEKVYKQNIKNKIQPFSYLELSDRDLKKSLNLAAEIIQEKWHQHSPRKESELDSEPSPSTIISDSALSSSSAAPRHLTAKIIKDRLQQHGPNLVDKEEPYSPSTTATSTSASSLNPTPRSPRGDNTL
jgi:hypothetical protein